MAEYNKRGGFGGGSRDGGFRRSSGGGFGGGRPSFGGGERSRFNRPGNREFRQTQMHSAVCAECGKACEVPFKPNGDKPVYCNYCFGKNKEGSSGEYQKRDSGSSSSYQAPAPRPQADNTQIADLQRQLNAVNAKVDYIMSILVKNFGAPEKKVEEKKDVKPSEKEIEKAAAKKEFKKVDAVALGDAVNKVVKKSAKKSASKKK